MKMKEALVVTLLFLIVGPVAATTSSVELTDSWGWGSSWTASLKCNIELPFDYKPDTPPHGFYIRVILEGHAKDITVYYPFDTQSVTINYLFGHKEFVIQTKEDIWESRGIKTYNFLVTFADVTGQPSVNWPKGTCSGPFPKGDSQATTTQDVPTTTTETTTTTSTTTTMTTTTVGPTTSTEPTQSTTSHTTTAGEVVGSTVEFRQEWGVGTSVWTASLTCTLDLPVNYSPTGAQQGFYMKILLEDHATEDIMVYWPFDDQSVTMKQLTGEKEFTVYTQQNIWLNEGPQSCDFQIKFINEDLTVTGKWPRGTCSGPYSLETGATQTNPTTQSTTVAEDGNDGTCPADCTLPDCSCPRFSYPMETSEIPQMVYFGFDDAVTPPIADYLDDIFTTDRRNPNNCRITFTLYINDEYTDYTRVKNFYDNGNEMAVHSVTHTSINNDDILRAEATEQKQSLIDNGVLAKDIVGWRSPFLQTAGTNQPKILHELGYEYDISLTYLITNMTDPKPWPFTIENGWPYTCGVPPCPAGNNEKGFWVFPVMSLLDHEQNYSCPFVDGCSVRAENEDEAFAYLWNNFMSYYSTTRTPFGLNMHAGWFYTEHNLKGTKMFLDEIQKLNDVYVISVKQILDWMKQPTPLSDISQMTSWECADVSWPLTP